MDKIVNVLKKQGLAILGLVIMGGYGWVSNLVQKGHEVERKDEIINVIKSEESTKYINLLITEAIEKAMSNPLTIIDMLSSPHIEKYADSKAIEVEEAVKKRLLKEDSIKGDLIHDLGIGTGMRNEDILPQLIKLITAFKEGKLTSNRQVRATF